MTQKKGVGPNRVFHRVATGDKNQDFRTVISQVFTSEMWGATAMYGSKFPSVRALKEELPDGVDGIEFETDVLPTPSSETPREVYWKLHSDSDWVESREGEEFACIKVVIRKVRYTKEANLKPNVEWKP